MQMEGQRTQNPDGFCGKVMTDDQVDQLRKQIAVYAVICEQLVDMHKAFTAQHHDHLSGSSSTRFSSFTVLGFAICASFFYGLMGTYCFVFHWVSASLCCLFFGGFCEECKDYRRKS